MAHKKTTSKRVAKKASKLLRDPKTPKKYRSVIASDLAQSPGKHRRKRKK